MFEWQDLFQWDRFITPTVIKTFYWLIVVIVVLAGLSGVLSGLSLMVVSPFAGFISILISVIGIVAGIFFARVIAEIVLIVFRINEHLGAIRDRGQF